MSETLTPRRGRSPYTARSSRRQAPPDPQLGLFDDEPVVPAAIAEPTESPEAKPVPIALKLAPDDAQTPEQVQTLDWIVTYLALGAIETARNSAA
ncbi:MAG: hypothetical protein HPY44_22030 [Armatimonadetes bacterium]|nr:hypothetical protein [Armatimonadota bacterium]